MNQNQNQRNQPLPIGMGADQMLAMMQQGYLPTPVEQMQYYQSVGAQQLMNPAPQIQQLLGSNFSAIDANHSLITRGAGMLAPALTQIAGSAQMLSELTDNDMKSYQQAQAMTNMGR